MWFSEVVIVGIYIMPVGSVVKTAIHDLPDNAAVLDKNGDRIRHFVRTAQSVSEERRIWFQQNGRRVR